MGLSRNNPCIGSLWYDLWGVMARNQGRMALYEAIQKSQKKADPERSTQNVRSRPANRSGRKKPRKSLLGRQKTASWPPKKKQIGVLGSIAKSYWKMAALVIVAALVFWAGMKLMNNMKAPSGIVPDKLGSTGPEDGENADNETETVSGQDEKEPAVVFFRCVYALLRCFTIF